MRKIYLLPILALSLGACIRPVHTTEKSTTPSTTPSDQLATLSPINKAVLSKNCTAGDQRACNVQSILMRGCPAAVEISIIYACWVNGYPINRVWFDTSAGPLPTAVATIPVQLPTPISTPAAAIPSTKEPKK